MVYFTVKFLSYGVMRRGTSRLVEDNIGQFGGSYFSLKR